MIVSPGRSDTNRPLPVALETLARQVMLRCRCMQSHEPMLIWGGGGGSFCRRKKKERITRMQRVLIGKMSPDIPGKGTKGRGKREKKCFGLIDGSPN